MVDLDKIRSLLFDAKCSTLTSAAAELNAEVLQHVPDMVRELEDLRRMRALVAAALAGGA